MIKLLPLQKPYYPWPEVIREQILEKISQNKHFSPVSKILLINPLQIPSKYFDESMAKNSRYFCYPPYGLGVVAKIAKSQGFHVEILDLNFKLLSSPEKQVDVKKCIKNFLKRELDRYQPDLVGITCMFTITHESFKDTVQEVRALMPKVLIVAGGVHITNDELRIKKDIPEIDFTLTNESEFAFIDLLNIINQESRGECSKQSLMETNIGQIDVSPDFCNLPITEYSQFGDIGSYRFWWNNGARAATIQGNRGCRARCTFCSVENFNGKGVRGRSVSSILSEIERYKKKYGINHIMWLDDDLFYNPNRALELFKAIIDEKFEITWDASNGVIASAVTQELLSAAAESGCIGMHVGIESGSRRVLKEVRKPSGIKHFLDLGKWLQDYPKIFSKGFLMMGFPNETFGELRETIKLAQEMKLDWYTISVLTALPSTKIYDQMVELGLIATDSITSESANYGSMQTGTQKNFEKKNLANAGNILKISDYADNEKIERTRLTELWFEVDYLINYVPIHKVKNQERRKKLSLFLQDVNRRMTNNTNPVSLYYESLVLKNMGNHIKASEVLKKSNEALYKSDLWQKRCEHLNLIGEINA